MNNLSSYNSVNTSHSFTYHNSLITEILNRVFDCLLLKLRTFRPSKHCLRNAAGASFPTFRASNTYLSDFDSDYFKKLRFLQQAVKSMLLRRSSSITHRELFVEEPRQLFLGAFEFNHIFRPIFRILTVHVSESF